MVVRNINGTSQNRCSCGSWIKHWRNFSGQTANVCRARGCSRRDLHGAHVQKAYTSDQKWYIVPLCTYHNRSRGNIALVPYTKLVSANKSKTCGQSGFW